MASITGIFDAAKDGTELLKDSKLVKTSISGIEKATSGISSGVEKVASAGKEWKLGRDAKKAEKAEQATTRVGRHAAENTLGKKAWKVTKGVGSVGGAAAGLGIKGAGKVVGGTAKKASSVLLGKNKKSGLSTFLKGSAIAAMLSLLIKPDFVKALGALSKTTPNTSGVANTSGTSNQGSVSNTAEQQQKISDQTAANLNASTQDVVNNTGNTAKNNYNQKAVTNINQVAQTNQKQPETTAQVSNTNDHEHELS